MSTYWSLHHMKMLIVVAANIAFHFYLLTCLMSCRICHQHSLYLTLPAGQMPALGRHPALRPQHSL